MNFLVFLKFEFRVLDFGCWLLYFCIPHWGKAIKSLLWKWTFHRKLVDPPSRILIDWESKTEQMSVTCMCVRDTFSHTIFSALAGRILSGSMLVDPSWCPIGSYWILLKLVKYFKSYVQNTILVKFRKLYNKVVFATSTVK